MEGVGPGTTLDGRYTTQRRIEQRHGSERWTADDTTLGRSVVVLCLPEADSRSSALLDAARRAAGLDTPTLQRVLDVGRENGLAWVIESDTSGSRSLAQLVHEGGLPADEVRRIVGEVATALESARQRGLHHLDLRPEDVLRTLDGEVRVRGVATSSALVELDDLESDDASRRDAVGVVSLTYAGLTGLWPGSGQTSLGSAPRVLGGVAAPSEIAAGVPRDLDALCRLTLGEDQGPTSPGDFARQIAPWPSRQVAGRATIATTGAADPRRSARVSPAATPLVEPSTPDAPVEVIAGSPVTEAIPLSVEAGVPTPFSELDSTAEFAVVPPAPTPPPVAEMPAPVVDSAAAVEGPTGENTGEIAGEGVTVVPESYVPESYVTHSDASPSENVSDLGSTAGAHAAEPAAGSSAAGSAAAAAAAAGAAMAGAGTAVAGAMSRVGSRVGSLSRQVGDRAAEKAAERRGFRERITAPNAPGLTPDGERLRPGTGTDAFLEAPAPLVPAEPLSRDESKLALGIVAGFLVLALIVGLWGVSRIGSNTNLDLGGVPKRSAKPTTGSSPSGSAARPSASATTGEALQILGADGFDPQGDGRENGTRAPRVFDGDPSTVWRSEGYASAELGGLKKGVGVSVDLGPNVSAREISLTLANRADVEVYVGAERSLSEAVKVGRKTDANGKVTFPVKAGTTGQYVIVWFTRLTTDDTGRYRAILGEVEVKN